MADAPSPDVEAESGVGLLDIKDGCVFVYARGGAPVGRLHLIGHGDFVEASADQALSRVNLIADSDFRDERPRWRSSDPEHELASVQADKALAPIAPNAHRALKLSVRRSDPDDSKRYFVTYEDPAWGKRLPVTPGVAYRFRVRARSRRSIIALRSEFFDDRGKRMPDANVETRFQIDPVTGVDSAHTLEAVAPAGARAMSAVIVITAAGPMPVGTHVDAWFGEPMLWRRRGDDLTSWRPRPENFAGYYALLGGSGAKLYAIPLSRQGLLETGRSLCVVGAGDKPLIEIGIDSFGAHSAARGEFGKLDGRTLSAKLRHYSGIVNLMIDGSHVATGSIVAGTTPKSVRFEIPESFHDGEAHFLELVDDTTIKRLAVDYLVLPALLTPWSALAHYSASPLPGELGKRAGARMRAMRSQLDYFSAREEVAGQDLWLLRNLARMVEVVTRGIEENSDCFALEFPEVETPAVSVIVPVHGKYSVTFVCLCSLLLARNDARFELIVVDDGSTDATGEELARHRGITIVTHVGAQGFIGACKAGAERARGEYLLFLNNDVEVTSGWIDELLRVFEIFPGTGAACSKLLFPDGSLQDAGGIVWSNGAPWNYGRRQNAADPRFGYSRDADYLSGAALITPTRVWNEIGGFADELRPAYYEDTWYSFAVRELGLRTIYCALSTVYHVQGVSNGTDVRTETGLKRFQKINEPKFKRRWADAYLGHGVEGVDPDREKDRRARGRILVLDWSMPRPDRDAGSFAAVQEMRLFQALGYKVTFLPVNLANLGSYTLDLNRLGIETVTAPFAVDLADFLRRRDGEFDLVLVNRHNVGGPIIDTIRTHAPDARVILNVADLHFLREMRRALLVGDKEAEAEAHELREHELSIMRKFDLVLSYSDFEVGLMTALLGSDVAVDRLPWVQPIEADANAPREPGSRRDLCFLGSYNHPPNADAVAFFARTVMPDVDTVLHVYGSSWPREGMPELGPRVRIEGYAPDLGAMFAQHRICVVPLRSGAGVKGKVLMAMAHGIPCILSPIAAEAIAIVDGENCLIAQSGEEWRAAIDRLQSDDALWSKLSTAGIEFIANKYAFDAGVAQLSRVLEKLDIYA